MVGNYKKYIIKVNEATGEILSERVQTERQDDGYKQCLQNAADYGAVGYQIRKQCEELGGFTWLIYNPGVVLNLGLKPDELTKLIFMSSFMRYDNYLSQYDGQQMTKNDIRSELRIGRTKATEFFGNLTDRNIMTVDSDGYVKLNSDIFYKGKVKDVGEDQKTIKLYRNAIKQLYEKTKPNEHRLLSCVYQVIPFVNVKYNIICSNPDEELLRNVYPLSIAEYSQLIGYSEDNARRLRTTLKKITVDEEYVFGFVNSGAGDSIFINPCVYYGGKDYDKVKELGKFCEKRGDKD